MLTDTDLQQHIFENKNDHHGGSQNIENINKTEKPTILFYSYHMDKNIKKISKYFGDNIQFDPLFIKLNQIYTKHKNNHKLITKLYEYYIVFHGIFMIPISLLFFILNPVNVFSVSLLSFSFLYYVFNVFHLRHHKGSIRIQKNIYEKYVNPLLSNYERFMAIDPTHWNTQHNLSHHVNTNQKDDMDVIIVYPFYRISPIQKLLWHHKYQKYYILPLLALNGFSFPFYNLFFCNPSMSQFAYFILYYVLLLILPYYFGGYTFIQTFIVFFITIFVMGFLTTLMFQVSHNDISHHTEIQGFTDFKSWIKMQVLESCNWGGLMGAVLFGGINYQIDHHIAPAVNPIILYYASEEIETLLKEELNISFVRHDNFIDASKSYLKHIENMSH